MTLNNRAGAMQKWQGRLAKGSFRRLRLRAERRVQRCQQGHTSRASLPPDDGSGEASFHFAHAMCPET